MRTVRRLYFYAVAFVSLEIVLWGLIGLARSIFASAHVVSNSGERLAQALALILVGVPVFGLHWWMAQRNALQDMEEHASGVRAVFLYGALLATLIPIAQNFLALLDRVLLQGFNLSTYQAMLGPNQTWSDNLIAMVMNAIVAAYFITILRADWGVVTPQETLAGIRRIYRYIWVLYSLAYVVAGVQQILRFLLNLSPDPAGMLLRPFFVNGLTLLLLGTPLWFFAWRTVQDSLGGQAERESLLRLGVLYFLGLAGVVSVLTAGGMTADVLLRLLFGEHMDLQEFLRRVSGPLSIGIPLAGVWAYYGRWLGRAMSESLDLPRRAGMRRLYYYVLSAVGLGTTFTGLALLLAFVLDAAIGNLVWADTLRPRLAAALATVVAGLPLWGLTWQPMQAEALAAGGPGDHARRSILRRVYLYLVLFASVVGGMIASVGLLNVLLKALLEGAPSGFARQVLKFIEVLVLFVGMGVYHGLTLRRDGRMAGHSLAEKHAAFAVLVFDPGDGAFAQTLLAALQKQTPSLPAVSQPTGKPVTKDADVRAVILPADLALDPPESLRRWLAKFDGHRLAVPRPAPGWTWTGGVPPLPAAANQAALAVRQLAEGQEIRPQGGTPGWMIVVYILAGLSGLVILMALIGLVASLFTR